MIDSRTAGSAPRTDPVRRGGRPSGVADDRGITLVEVVVALSLMSAFLAILTTGLVRLYGSANHVQAMVGAQAQIHIAFQRLDAEIRYAASISQEGIVAGGNDWYVEYLTTHTGTPVCTGLRLTAGGLLQKRRWDEGAAPPAFTTLASGVSGAHPFTRTAAGVDGYTFERLAVSVSASGGRDARTRQIDVAFTALNSSPDTSSDTTCTDGRPTS